MDWQFAVTAAVVALCGAYAAWSLLPRSLRLRLAGTHGRDPARAGAACGGCDGCGGGAAPRDPAQPAVIRIVRRPPGAP